MELASVMSKLLLKTDSAKRMWRPQCCSKALLENVPAKGLRDLGAQMPVGDLDRPPRTHPLNPLFDTFSGSKRYKRQIVSTILAIKQIPKGKAQED